MLLLLVFFNLYIISSLHGMNHYDHQWCNTLNAPYTIFFQGLMASQLQLAKYTQKFTATTGQDVCASDKSIDIVFKPFIGKELDEVIPWHPSMTMVQKLQASVSYYLQQQYYEYKVGPPTRQYDISGHAIDFSKINIGQEADIKEHKRKYDLFTQKYPGRSCILFGVARGAAATFRAAIKYQYPARLIILEGCFDDVETMLKQKFPCSHDFISAALQAFTQYDPDVQRLDLLVKNFPANIPVVFINSFKDEEVPYKCARNLAIQLAKRRQNEVYLITLYNAAHATYTMDNEFDRNRYQAGLHAIFKKYNLPYILSYAQQGKEFMQDLLITP